MKAFYTCLWLCLLVVLALIAAAQEPSKVVDKTILSVSEDELIRSIQGIPLDSPIQGVLITRANASHLSDVAYQQYQTLQQRSPNDFYANLRLGEAAFDYWHSTMQGKPGQPVGTANSSSIADIAMSSLTKAVTLDPKSGIANAELGAFLFFLGYQSQGLSYLRKAEELAPNNPSVLDFEGEVHFTPTPLSYQPQKAEEELTKAARLAPTLSFTYWALSELYMIRGNYSKARKMFHIYVGLLPPALAHGDNVKILQKEVAQFP